MSISNINENLLRAIGVGVAIIRATDMQMIFQNESFTEWFGSGMDTTLTDLLEGLDPDAVSGVLETGVRFAGEVQIKPKRRTLVIAVTISLATSQDAPLLVVECQNTTRIRELESMIDSYSTMVERNTRELEREKERVERLLLNVMPRAVYEEFKTFGVVTPTAIPRSIGGDAGLCELHGFRRQNRSDRHAWRAERYFHSV